MPNFSYQGINNHGKNTSGVIDAESEKAARVKLRKIGVFPTVVGLEGKVKKGGSGGFSFNANVDLGKYFQTINGKDLATMSRQLATLVGAHIPIVDALSALVEQTTNTKLKSILVDVKDKITQGARLSDAMAAYPDVFSNIFISMVSAGEASGALEVVLDRLATLTEKSAALKSKITGALMYPLIMSIVGMALMGFLLVYVVPKVTKIFEDVKATLPIPTQILIWVSHNLADYWYLVILGGVGIFFGIKKLINTPKGRTYYDGLTLRLPIFGNLFKLVAVSRFARTLATMLGSGVELLKAMDIVKNIMENTLLIKAIEDTKNSVREGESIAEPLKRSGFFPPLVTHMISIGEKTGQLEMMMIRVADTYDQQVDNVVSTMTTLLEPLMILVMGGVVGFIVMSILLPILQLNDIGG
ncbi:MAG: type II secretion system inner membrane protein GspF [Deltaproteobacteria bacterium]|nr:MAG: type II secretion system inner membrane protein GspF [Deltaproteobacteria bacterium]